MSERLSEPSSSQFPKLDADSQWVREIPSGSTLARVFRAGGVHPTQWHDFRQYGPLDARFDPHPEIVGNYPQHSVMYTTLASSDDAADQSQATDSALATCLLEVFQQHRIIRRIEGTPTLAVFKITRPLRLLDLSDSDWITVAGGNSAITSGEHAQSRAWARAIREIYPGIDGVHAASSLLPASRIAALWTPAVSAVPAHPIALIRLDRDELTGVIDSIAERYNYLLL